jgi:hypothetical protein
VIVIIERELKIKQDHSIEFGEIKEVGVYWLP